MVSWYFANDIFIQISAVLLAKFPVIWVWHLFESSAPLNANLLVSVFKSSTYSRAVLNRVRCLIEGSIIK